MCSCSQLCCDSMVIAIKRTMFASVADRWIPEVPSFGSGTSCPPSFEEHVPKFPIHPIPPILGGMPLTSARDTLERPTVWLTRFIEPPSRDIATWIRPAGDDSLSLSDLIKLSLS